MKSREPQARDWTSRRHLIVGLSLCFVTLAAYSNSFGGGFVMDSRGLILQDQRVHAVTAENLDLIVGHTYWWPYGESGLFRPLTTLSYLFNYAVLGNGEHPAGYHWLNLLLHMGNVLLVYALGLRLSDWRRAAAVAGLWAVHPMLTESVTNIVGRADLLAGMAVLGGLLLYWKSTEAEGAGRWAWLTALSAVTAAGVFSKESAVMLLPVVCLYEAVYWRERRGRGLLAGVLAMLLPVQAMLYQRAAVLWAAGPTEFPFYDNPIVGAGWVSGRLTALNVMGKYVALLAWPWRLSSDYSWARITPGGGDLPACIALAGLAATAVWLWRGERVAWFAACAALLVFLPTSNLLFPIGTVMAERFMYLPAIAFAAGIAAIVGRLEGRAATAALVAIGLAWAGRTWARNLDWQDDVALAASAVAASPESFKSHLMLANALFEADPSHANIDRVLSEAEMSIAILEPLPPLRNNPGAMRRVAAWYLAKEEGAHGGKASRRALEILERCRMLIAAAKEDAERRGDGTRAEPLAASSGDVDRLIAAAYLKLGDPSRALASAADALAADLSNPEVYRDYARALAAQGRPAEAVTVLMEGVMLTLDAGLRQSVVDLYASGLDPRGCALMPGQNGSKALNPGCQTVHEHLCLATAGAMKLRLRHGRRDMAEQLRNTGLKDFACAAAPLDEILTGR